MSAASFAAERPDHLLPVGMATKGSMQGLQHRDEITYNLRAADGHQKVSREFVMKEQ